MLELLAQTYATDNRLMLAWIDHEWNQAGYSTDLGTIIVDFSLEIARSA